MKKFTLLPILLWATISLNGMASRLVQSGRQLSNTLRQMGRGAQQLHLPATIPGTTCQTFSSSRAYQHAQGAYGAGNKQHTSGNSRVLFLGGAASLAAATVAAQDAQDESREGRMLGLARRAYATENGIEDNPEVAATLKSLQGKYLKLKKGYNSGKWQVLETLEKYPASKNLLIQAVIDNIAGITTADYRFEDAFSNTPVLKILKHYPESRVPIVTAITSKDNFASIVLDRSSHGRIHIFEILEKYHEAKAPIIQATADNFVTLANNYEGIEFMDKLILEKYPEDGAPIINTLINNLPKIISSGNIVIFIKKIMERYPESRDQIASAIVNNMPRMVMPCTTVENMKSNIRLSHYESIMTEILEKYPESATPIIQFTIDNASEVAETKAGKRRLEFIQNKYPDLAISRAAARILE